MAGKIRAVIDIGTNSVKLLVAEVEGQAVRPLHETSRQTRLGQGFYPAHVLQTAAIHETARSVADFAREAEVWKPRHIRVIATSAARDARNKKELIEAVSETSRLPVTILSGEREADWAYRGVTSDPSLLAQPLLVMDTGGGSTEFILGRGGERLFAESFPLGSVRLLEQLALDDPPSSGQLARCEEEIDQVLETQVRPHLDPALETLQAPPQLVGTGGTSTILARIQLSLPGYQRELIEGALLTHEDLRREKVRLWGLPLAERRRIIGLPPNRADVILPGAVIFERVMRAFGLPALRVSTRGIRFAALLDDG